VPSQTWLMRALAPEVRLFSIAYRLRTMEGAD
jgi:hypothetical protein